MRLDIDIAADGALEMGAGFVQTVAEQALIRGVRHIDVALVFELEVVFVSEEKIKAINKEYRDKDVVTDVLSFGDYAATGLPMKLSQPEPVMLGQLFLCYEYIVRAAEEDSVSLEREMAYILSHGVLHLLGHNHTEEMFVIQDQISQQYA